MDLEVCIIYIMSQNVFTENELEVLRESGETFRRLSSEGFLTHLENLQFSHPVDALIVRICSTKSYSDLRISYRMAGVLGLELASNSRVLYYIGINKIVYDIAELLVLIQEELRRILYFLKPAVLDEFLKNLHISQNDLENFMIQQEINTQASNMSSQAVGPTNTGWTQATWPNTSSPYSIDATIASIDYVNAQIDTQVRSYEQSVQSQQKIIEDLQSQIKDLTEMMHNLKN